MPALFRKAVFPGKYIQGPGARFELSAMLGSFGRSLIVSAPSALATVIADLRSALPEGARVERFHGECCRAELERLGAILHGQQYAAVVGIGGGKTIDTAKIVADRCGLPAIIVPTIASTDAPCSACAVIYTNAGVFQEVEYQRRNPEAVLVDTEIIARAPVRFLVSGMGDALATWFEARSCARTSSPNECGGVSTLAGLALAELCLKTLVASGVEAKTACEQRVVTPALERIVEANTLLSGVGFESGGLAAAHAIHNGLTALEETHAYYHGEKVAFGVLAGLHLGDGDPAEIGQVYEFCELVGLPTTLAQIGLEGVSADRLRFAAAQACLEGSSIYHEGGVINAERVCAAMAAADGVGLARRAERGSGKT